MIHVNDSYSCEVYPKKRGYFAIVKDLDRTVGSVEGLTLWSTNFKAKRLYNKHQKAKSKNVKSTILEQRDMLWARRLKQTQGDVKSIPRMEKWIALHGYGEILNDVTEMRLNELAKLGRAQPNLYISLQMDGSHLPVLDLDFPAKLVPSRTEGNWHLYLDRAVSWDKYQRLLLAMADAGLIERGYCDASIAKGYTAVRIPPENEMLQEAIEELDDLLLF